jgi:protein ImuB
LNPQQKETLRHIRTLRLPVPAKESKFLLKLLQLDLQAHPPTSEVIAVHVLAVPASARSRQLGLFLPLSPEPERLEVTLARIQKTVGEGRVGAPVLLDTHRPNAFEQNRFMVKDAAAQAEHLAPARPATAALRIYRPPLPAAVQLHDGKPAQLDCSGVRRQIFSFAGPWRTKGDWWSETVWARDEWDVELRALQPKSPASAAGFDPRADSAGDAAAQGETALYRIYKDLRSKRWFVEGIYD